MVALVVTIVVLLILSGITITTLFGDNGIINKAREAADATNNADKDTEQGLENLANDMNTAIGGNSGGGKVEVGKLVPIDTKFEKYTDDTSSTPVPIPGGYCVVGDSKTNTNNTNTIASGLVISDLANDTLDNLPITVDGTSKRGNQFVWVPVSSSELANMYGVDSTNSATAKKHGKLYEFGKRGAQDSSTGLYNWTIYDTPKALNWTETETTPKVMSITSSSSYREPDILRNTSYGDAVTGQATKGIEQLKTVVGIATTGTEATEDANVLKNWEKELQDKFDEMIGSVQKYGGFYIGRYETGNLSNSDNTVKAVVQKGATVGGPNWYYQYQEIKNMAKDNSNVTTSMIWGCQFDRTLEWIAQTNQKDGKPDYSLLTDSRSWGNYKDSTGDAATNSGGSSPKTSGYNEAWQKNHIYDLAGNAYDWTIEARSTDGRVNRGGSYNNFRYWLSSVQPQQRPSELQLRLLPVVGSHFM